MRNHSIALCLAAYALASATIVSADVSPPTTDDIQKSYDAQKYPEALKAIHAALAVSGPEAAQYVRHDLFMMGADCALHMKQPLAAVDLLNAAQKDADKAQNAKQSAETIAFIFLIQNSPNNIYVTKNDGTSEKIDILDKTAHDKLYDALFTDLKARCDDRIRAANESSSLTPIIESAKLFTTLRAIELAGTGTTPKSDALALDTQKWAAKMIRTTLNTFDNRIGRIQTDSNVDAKGKIQPDHPAGISNADISNLHEIMKECQKIPDAIKSFDQIFAIPTPLLKESTHAQNVFDRAGSTLSQNKTVGNGRS